MCLQSSLFFTSLTIDDKRYMVIFLQDIYRYFNIFSRKIFLQDIIIFLQKQHNKINKIITAEI